MITGINKALKIVRAFGTFNTFTLLLTNRISRYNLYLTFFDWFLIIVSISNKFESKSKYLSIIGYYYIIEAGNKALK